MRNPIKLRIAENINEDYSSELKSFVENSLDEIIAIGIKCGYRVFTDIYESHTSIDGDYITVLCIDASEMYGNRADIVKLQKSLDKFFRKRGYRYYIQEMYTRGLGDIKICVYN